MIGTAWRGSRVEKRLQAAGPCGAGARFTRVG